MPSAKKPPAAAALDETRVAAALEALRLQLSADGAVKLSALKPKALAARLIPALVAEGFEVTKAWLRRPLAQQLEAALAHGAMVSRKALAAQVRGAAAAELQQAVAEAERAGKARRVLRGKAEAWVASDVAVLSAAELQRLRAAVGSLDKTLVQALRKPGVTLLVSDVEQALAEAAQLLSKPAASRGAGASAGEAALRSVVAAVGAERDAGTGLAFVPDIVRRLLPAMPVAVARDMLLLAASRELVELRPEGGLGRLTAEDLELCPPGPARTHLSWARVLAGGQG